MLFAREKPAFFSDCVLSFFFSFWSRYIQTTLMSCFHCSLELEMSFPRPAWLLLYCLSCIHFANPRETPCLSVADQVIQVIISAVDSFSWGFYRMFSVSIIYPKTLTAIVSQTAVLKLQIMSNICRFEASQGKRFISEAVKWRRGSTLAPTLLWVIRVRNRPS